MPVRWWRWRRRDPRRIPAREAIRGEPGPLIIPAQVTAEIDYLIGERIGPHASRAFIEDLAAARFRVECLLPDEYDKVADLSEHYGDLGLGLADLSLIVLGERFDCTRNRHVR